MLGSITPDLTYIVVAQGTEPQMGIKPGSALLLAFTNVTKPLRCHNGLVVLVNAYKSAVPRVHSWPGGHPFWLYVSYSAHTPPHPNLLHLLIANCAGKYSAESCLDHGSAVNETQSRESNPGPHLY